MLSWFADTVRGRVLPALSRMADTLRNFSVPWIDRLREGVSAALPRLVELGKTLGLLPQ